MRFVDLAIGALLSIAQFSPAAADDWKTYRFANGQFEAMFPSAPTLIDSFTTRRPGIVSHWVYMATRGTSFFGVNAYLLDEIQNPTEQLFRKSIDDMANSDGCSIVREQVVSRPAGQAHEVVLSNCRSIEEKNSVQHVDVYILGRWLYTVIGGGVTIGDQWFGEMFLQSFKQIPGT
jgi:hypothetical protein